MNEDVINSFICRFLGDASDVFTRGCCYWFAVILSQRFAACNAKIVYDQVSNHFGTRVFGKVFDITGDVTDKFSWEDWPVDDALLFERIKRDCIMF